MNLCSTALQRLIGGCGHFDQDRLTVSAPVHAIAHPSVARRLVAKAGRLKFKN